MGSGLTGEAYEAIKATFRRAPMRSRRRLTSRAGFGSRDGCKQRRKRGLQPSRSADRSLSLRRARANHGVVFGIDSPPVVDRELSSASGLGA